MTISERCKKIETLANQYLSEEADIRDIAYDIIMSGGADRTDEDIAHECAMRVAYQ